MGNNISKKKAKRNVKPGRNSSSASLAEKAYQYILHCITNGIFSPGERIGQERISQELGMSNIPVREAFAKLEHDGLIGWIRQKGACVKSFSIDEIEKLYRVRAMLEIGAVDVLAETISLKELSQLKDFIAQMRKAHLSNDVERYLEADCKYHRYLISATKNEVLEQVYDPIIIQINTYMSVMKITETAMSWAKDFEETEAMGHGPINEALKEKDKELAVEMIRKNLENACDLATSIMRAQQIMSA